MRVKLIFLVSIVCVLLICSKCSRQDQSSKSHTKYSKRNWLFSWCLKSLNKFYKYYDGFKFLIRNVNKIVFNTDEEITIESDYEDYFEVDKPIYKKELIYSSEHMFSEKKNNKRVLTNNKTSNSTKYKLCNDVGKTIPAKEVSYYCFGNPVSKDQYAYYIERKIGDCYKKTSDLTICVCPKDYEGINCEAKIYTTCAFTELFHNDTDLLQGRNTFYDEYSKRPLIAYSDTFKIKFNIKCRTNKNKPENYTYTNTNRDLIVDPQEIKKLKFTYFMDQNNITLTKTPKLTYLYKIYNMKKLYPERTLTNSITNPDDMRRVLRGENRVESLLSLRELNNGTTMFKDKIKVAGRIFYEFELKDQNNDMISFIHHQGQLEVDSIFPLKKSMLWVVGLVIVIVIAISIIIIVIICKKKKNDENKNRIYDSAHMDISRLSNNHQKIPNVAAD